MEQVRTAHVVTQDPGIKYVICVNCIAFYSNSTSPKSDGDALSTAVRVSILL